MRHVAGPQPEARQEQDDRAITPARNDFAVACRDQPVHLLRHQISRQVGKPPMGIARNDIGETCSAAAFDSKIPQERAQAGRQLLDGSIAAMARAVQEKAANSGRFPPFWFVPECRHQVGGVASVELDGAIGCPAVLAQPHFEAATNDGSGCCNARRGWQTPISTRCWRKSLAPKTVWWLRRPPMARGHRQVHKCSLNTARSQTGTNMLETYFSASKMLGHLRARWVILAI